MSAPKHETSEMTNSLSLMGLASGPLRGLLEKNVPGFRAIQNFFKNWLKIDMTTLALAVSAFGTAMAGVSEVHSLYPKLWSWIAKVFVSSVSVSGCDKLNHEVLHWVGANVLARQRARSLTAQTEATRDWDYQILTPQGTSDPFLKRVPINYDTVGSNGAENLVVMCMGRSVAPIKRLFETCRDFVEKQRESFVRVRVPSRGWQQGWDKVKLRPLRPLETVHFDQSVKDELIADIANYMASETRRFYQDCGIPYRRGILLYGPPGTGKTSLSVALAGRFDLDLYLLHLSAVRDDGDLESLSRRLPARCLVVVEDIDAVGLKREERQQDHYRYGLGCTLSGLLNALDGIASQEGRLVMMTTNIPEDLDEALVRPGRIDKKIYLGKIGRASAKELFLRLFTSDDYANSVFAGVEKKQLEALATKFSRKIPEKLTPAQLQGYLLSHRGSPTMANARVVDWLADKDREEKCREKEAADREAARKAAEEAESKVRKESKGDGSSNSSEDSSDDDDKDAEDDGDTFQDTGD